MLVVVVLALFAVFQFTINFFFNFLFAENPAPVLIIKNKKEDLPCLCCLPCLLLVDDNHITSGEVAYWNFFSAVRELLHICSILGWVGEERGLVGDLAVGDILEVGTIGGVDDYAHNLLAFGNLVFDILSQLHQINISS